MSDYLGRLVDRIRSPQLPLRRTGRRLSKGKTAKRIPVRTSAPVEGTREDAEFPGAEKPSPAVPAIMGSHVANPIPAGHWINETIQPLTGNAEAQSWVPKKAASPRSKTKETLRNIKSDLPPAKTESSKRATHPPTEAPTFHSVDSPPLPVTRSTERNLAVEKTESSDSSDRIKPQASLYSIQTGRTDGIMPAPPAPMPPLSPDISLSKILGKETSGLPVEAGEPATQSASYPPLLPPKPGFSTMVRARAEPPTLVIDELNVEVLPAAPPPGPPQTIVKVFRPASDVGGKSRRGSKLRFGLGQL